MELNLDNNTINEIVLAYLFVDLSDNHDIIKSIKKELDDEKDYSPKMIKSVYHSIIKTSKKYAKERKNKGINPFKINIKSRNFQSAFKYLYLNNENFKNEVIHNSNTIFNKSNNNLYSNVLNCTLKGLGFLSIIVVFILANIYFTFFMICFGPSTKAKNVFVTTLLETGALKFVPNLVLNETTISNIVNLNSLKQMDIEMDTDKIKVSNENNNIEVEKIYGNNYYATMLIVHNPAKVQLATTYPFSKYGKTLDTLVKENDAIAGINGGLYESIGNKGGYPVGVVVSNGEIQYNRPNLKGLYLIGFDINNILRIISLSNMNSSEVEKLIKKEQIRDAVTFQEEFSDANNHFVKLIINGEKRKANGLGSGANPRSAIGQREDGTVLLLVTDGRGTGGHLGATANDLIDIMEQYGAVNAANIDGGSSSSMYYIDKYLMTSVTLYYNNSSWRLPDAFIVTK